MALDLYRAVLGFEIDQGASILSGSGAPGGDADVQDAATIGSVYYRIDVETNNLQIYNKISTAGNSTADWVQLASKSYVDSLVNGLSWREPVLIRSGVDTSIANATANLDADDTIDGVVVQAGDRLLFTNFTTDNNNVYIVSGSSGSWTLTESANAASDGDALFVQEGTSADQQWTYNGSTWEQFGGTSNAEIGFIRDFIGKTAAGALDPTYSSTNVVTQNGNLTAAIGELDADVGDKAYTEQNFVTDNETTTASLDALDIALSNTNDTIGNQTYTEQNFVTDGESATASIDALDIALNNIVGLNVAEETGVTGATTIDSVLVDNVEAVKWFVTIIDEGTPARKQSLEIFSMHDGTPSADATICDYNQASLLRVPAGSSITGLSVTVDVSGTGVTQEMRLRVSSTDAVTVKATRVQVV